MSYRSAVAQHLQTARGDGKNAGWNPSRIAADVTAQGNALMAEIQDTRKCMPVVLEGRLARDA